MFGLPFWAARALGIAALLAVAIGVGARLEHIWLAPQVKAAKAQVEAVEARARTMKAAQSAITYSGAAAEDKAQAALAQQARIIIRKVPVYVSSAPRPVVGCVTNGMLRLHDAAVLGIDPADLPPPSGESDAACAPVAPSDFMAAVASNYAAARANEEQLNSLEADVQARIEATGS